MKKFAVALLPTWLLLGCSSAIVSSAPSAWRHPFFYHENDFTGKGISDSKPMLLQTALRRETCSESFVHPLLNRCRPMIPERGREPASRPLSEKKIDDGLHIAAMARSGLPSGGLSFSRKGFGNDCSGFVLAVLAQAGYDLRSRLGTSGTASAAAIYELLSREGKVHRHKVPLPGDLVFFDNTYDRNRDGRANDPLTHVGIVERVDADGTFTFIHRVARGTLRYRMNLFHPHLRRDPKSGRVLNHALRFAERGRPARLAGELFHAFATVND